jgi:hypothetical protein
MDYAELVKRLEKADEYEPLGHDGWEAARAIEALVKELASLREIAKGAAEMGFERGREAGMREAANEIVEESEYLAGCILDLIEPQENER